MWNCRSIPICLTNMLKQIVWIPGPLPLDCIASLHTSSRSTEVPHSIPSRPEAPTHLGVSSTPQPRKREPARGSAPHCRRRQDDTFLFKTRSWTSQKRGGWCGYQVPFPYIVSPHYTQVQGQQRYLTPFREDPKHRPTSVCPPHHNHTRENLPGAPPHNGYNRLWFLG